MAAAERRSYLTLDGMRAVGAFLVVTRHVPDFFGGFQAPESYLAVDLFYLVSGFVVAHAYGQRLAAGGFFKTFFKTRLIRLYPLYFVGIVLGIAATVMTIVQHPHGWWTWPKLIEATITGFLLIPMLPGLQVNGSTMDGPIWTLVPELIANMVYAAAIRFMTLTVLVTIMAVCAAALVFAEFHAGTLDVGYGAYDGWAALARVGYSFFAGVVMFRVLSDKMVVSEWASWGCLIVLALALGVTPNDNIAPWYELGVVFVGFPALLALAVRFEPKFALTGRAFSYLGLISYGVYIIHQPIGHLLRPTLERVIRAPRGWPALPYAFGFLVFLVAVAGLLDRFYDAPARKLLRAKFLGGK
jgi:peptidoglycan/LPS O-acetylase OafA/YrhL